MEVIVRGKVDRLFGGFERGPTALVSEPAFASFASIIVQPSSSTIGRRCPLTDIQCGPGTSRSERARVRFQYLTSYLLAYNYLGPQLSRFLDDPLRSRPRRSEAS